MEPMIDPRKAGGKVDSFCGEMVKGMVHGNQVVF